MGCFGSKPEPVKAPVKKEPETILEKIEEAALEEIETCLCWEPCLYPECFNECSCPCGRAGTTVALFFHKATGAALYDAACCNCGEISKDFSEAMTITSKKERDAKGKKEAGTNKKKK